MKTALTSLRILTAVWLMVMLLPVVVAADEIPATANRQAAANTPAVIKSVKLVTRNNTPELLLEATSSLTYSSYLAKSPDRLVVDFAQTAADENLSVITFEQAPVSRLTTKSYETGVGILTRLELFLTQSVRPVLIPSDYKKGEIRITFPGYVAPKTETTESQTEKTPTIASAAALAEEPSTPAPEPAASNVQATAAPEKAAAVPGILTNIVPYGNGVDILIDGGFANFKTMRLNQPTRLVIDFDSVQAGAVDKFIQLKGDLLSTARIGTYPGRIRIVLDAVDGFVPDAEYMPTPNGLRISFPTHKSSNKVALTAPVKPVPVPAPVATPAPAPVTVKPAPVTAPVVTTVPAAPKPAVVQPGRIEAIDFQVVDGISRISIKTSGAVEAGKPVKTPGFLSLPIKNAILPRSLQRSFESKAFPGAVLRVTPVQASNRAGRETIIRVALRTDTPYLLRSESDMLYLEIENPAIPEKPAPVETPETDITVADSQKSTATEQTAEAASAKKAEALPPEAAVKPTEEPAQPLRPRYSGRRVTLEFADAEVGKILQLLAEVSDRNFIFGDDVGKQKISMKLNNVPWDQALAIILENNNLDKYDDGNVTQIRKKGSFKSQREEEIELRKAIYQSEPLITELIEVNYSQIRDIKKQFMAIKKAYGDIGTIEEDERTGKIIITSIAPAIAEMKKLHKELDIPERQVMIEARIVEASSSFARSLGVNWGLHYRDGSASIAGINSFDTNFGGLTAVSPPAAGASGQPGASAGISFGTLASNIKLDMRLNAAATAGMVRIVSTPKVATLNRKTAKITQGQQIPYTSATSDKVETKFVEAALSLEVTPFINPNGTIIMKIDAKNDSPSGMGDPPQINKKQATTEMMLRDGETTVIGGIFVENESNADDGVPFLQDVPLLGHLFKSTDVKRSRNELLIFITPRILNSMPNV